MEGSERDSNFLSNKQDFAYFLSPDNGDNLYASKVEEMVNHNKDRLIVNLRDINEYDPNLRRNILSNPMDYIPAWQEALGDFVKHSDFGSMEKQRKAIQDYKIGLKGSFGAHRVTPQRLMSQAIGTMVCCEGIVTKVSLVRPKVRETVHFCEATQSFTTQKYRDSTSLTGSQTSSTFPTTDSSGNLLTTEFGLSTFSDHQKIYIQDMPERTEPGSMPQTVECILDEDLVDCIKPGDRVQIIGIYRALSGRRAVGQSSGKFHTVILVNNVVKIGIGTHRENVESSLSAAEIKSIKKMSKKSNIFEILAESIIPSIYGHDFIKKAIILQLFGGVTKDLENGTHLFEILAESIIPSIYGHDFIKKAIILQLFGGVTKDLENGTHLRGDINILMIGDPSCGKSQLLRGVMNVGKLVINTTGRGSSGVGLTAAVTMDKDSGEKKLEAGAMVLADGGIVCIDEFDKMTDQDRTAIHEVMEQQTVTIAKAGIHTSLNARCSVIAAANPVYGMYDRYKKPHENIGLPDSLLSRFDLLFIVLDKIDTKIDRNISDHVLKMHLTPYNMHDDLNAMGDGLDMIDDDDDEYHDDDQDGKNAAVWSKQRVHKKQKIFTTEFVKKYIEFAKKQYKPVLTDEACQEIANKYAELRGQERNQTLPITARCLETIIRLSTAHAKLRLSKKIKMEDVDAAMNVLQFALTHDADPEHKKKAAARDLQDEAEEEDQKMMQPQSTQIPKRGKRKVVQDEEADVVMQDEAEEEDQKMMQLEEEEEARETPRGRKKKKARRKRDDEDATMRMPSTEKKKVRRSARISAVHQSQESEDNDAGDLDQEDVKKIMQ
eukprot:CAMPEP_0197072054 /NCGR_PEP_ID=MMETSP1384-20130603/209900_1 /TAXON_ID=29189 /ORGANISM="Ammonia sp." /LENGTH=829 /DNA_ID=CAMNT_0042510867 /DNA_START=146 /DNA_END=2633 /DNA_ORIENTATION=-